MADPQLNALPRALSLVPTSGVQHVNIRHPERFTVVGNHLAQHEGLSLTAIGLATHVQSLKAGSIISIRELAKRFPESEKRVADAFRELEATGYIARVRLRLPSGKMVTVTVSYNNPPAMRAQRETEAPTPAPASAPPPPRTAAEPEAPQEPPAAPDPVVHDLLAGLRRQDSRLLLSERDIRRLAPGVARWLERGVDPAAVQRTLTSALPPGPIHGPAALLGYRLHAMLPPPLPAAPVAVRPDPMQNCDACDRGFRAAAPGCCPECAAGLEASVPVAA
ncbi:helix-turn-helix domain-containing protein [Streptomyces sp. NPDC048389]|uniref:helix-turn-helix domain-containing protein n=1 Tax=Streptomyces sp. NPDC048389 TaxID=3154622 RepID=UPI0034536573